MTKLVFFDIDGTLITRNNHIPKSTLDAIAQLKKNGHIPVIATGRAPILLKEVAERLKIDSYVSMNGQYIVYQGEVVYRNPLEQTLVNQVVEFAKEQRDGLVLFTEDEIVSNSLVSLANRGIFFTLAKGLVGIIPERIKLSLWKRMMNKAPAEDTYANKEIFMMNIMANQEEELAYKETFSSLNFTRANTMSMDVVKDGISKATGAQQMMSILGVDHKNTYAFGDGLNDLELLRFVNTGVAMGNGFEELKVAADFVTDSVFDDGLAKGLKKLDLL